VKCGESSSLPLERSGFLVFADGQGHDDFSLYSDACSNIATLIQLG
jgi:hypothetical protein